MDRLVCFALVLLAASASFVCAATHSDTGSYIVKDGKARCVIVLPDAPALSEKRAAIELQDYVAQVSGAKLQQIFESAYTAKTGPCISIGRTNLSKEFVSDEQLKELGTDGYRIFRENGNTFFVGGLKRGSLYAVYDFLESLGIRWCSPDYTVVPKSVDVKAPAKSFEYIPQIWYRDQYWNNGFTPEWLARMRQNGNNGQLPRLPEDLGGSAVTMYGCHTFGIIVPPGQYYDKHPDWFSLKEDGKRYGSELCLTNPDLREFVISRVLADLKGNPEVNYYWLSQNDGGASGCFCDTCTAERLEHGGKDRWSANMISFVSYVADHVKKDFPDIRIKTLAYSYTQAAPDNQTAADNIIVELCGIFRPGDDPNAKLVKAWSKVAKNIEVYTYGGSNYGYWWPYPNVWDVGMQYRWAYDCGVRAVYTQGTALGKGSGLVDMKAYISARLAWDPSRDVRKEMQEFSQTFYGPAGVYIIEYLNWYSAYIRQHKMWMEGGWGDDNRWKDWVTKEAMVHCDAIFQLALAAAKSNPVYLNHVRRAYLEVLWGRIMVDLAPNSHLSDKELVPLPGVDVSALKARAKLFGQIMAENGYDHWHEALPYDVEKYPH